MIAFQKFINCTMKRIACLLSFTFLLFGISANAQTFRAGLTMGAVASDIHGMDTRDRDDDFNKLGYVIGGIVNTSLDKKNTFQMEMNYIKKGTMQKPDSMNNGYYKLALDYIEVPFLLRHRMHFNIAKKPIDRFDWELGASVGRMVRSSWTRGNYLYDIDFSKINKTDVSFFLGLNYNISFHSSLSFRYSNSVIPAVKHDVIPGFLIPYYFNTGNNMVFQMSLKLIFGGSAEKAVDTP
jgi:hypothetical protein